jgi:pyruvate,orthophosphate dikinase
MKIVVDLVKDGLISEADGVRRIDPSTLDQLLHPTIDPTAKRKVVAKGLPASPGAATGAIVFSSDLAEKAKNSGKKVILVRQETSPEDIHGMHAAEGILTTRGGMTSHAAVVARGMGKPCVSGASTIKVDLVVGTLTAGSKVFKTDDVITIDGSTGEILDGSVKMLEPDLSADFTTVMNWADRIKRMKVRANAETPTDARQAVQLGAEGIGLVRTEHMFFEGSRILAMREMILADEEQGRRRALAKLLPIQRLDFEELFGIMSGLPVTIRLLDPPLHEFLPNTDEEVAELARSLRVTEATIRDRANELHEFNPMLGFRGCRLAVAYPEIAEMQARAIFEAAINVYKATGKMVMPEIMVPLVMERAELDFIRRRIEGVAADVEKEQGIGVAHQIGTMIELPRAAIRAGDIATSAEFFSFGTNDLTQTTLGISRDDASKFIDIYRQRGLLGFDPFVTLDQEGVGELVQLGVERARRSNPSIKLGVCGEHGGNPASINFFEKVGLAYISCSPYRVPIARLAAAQATLNQGERDSDAPAPGAAGFRAKSRPGAQVRMAKPVH